MTTSAVEPTVFQKKLATTFRRHPNIDEVGKILVPFPHSSSPVLTFSQAVEEFCEGLKVYTDDSVR